MPRTSLPTRSSALWTRWQVGVAETGDGNPVCLSLANTRNWRRSAEPREHLHAYADLLQWAQGKGLLDAGGAATLERRAAMHPRAARAELERTIAVRDAVYRVFSERAQGRTLPQRDLALIVGAFNEAVARVELALEHGRLALRARTDEIAFDTARLQAALSAVSLLTTDLDGRVKECADDRGCGWLFVDETRNASRRFCFSNECGNRARQAAFRQRRREAASATAG